MDFRGAQSTLRVKPPGHRFNQRLTAKGAENAPGREGVVVGMSPCPAPLGVLRDPRAICGCGRWRLREINSVASSPGDLASFAVGRRYAWPRSRFHAGRTIVFTADERLGQSARFVIGELFGRALHEIARRADQRSADAAVEGELGAADGVDDHPGGIRRIPDFELQLASERQIAEARAFEAD